MEPVVILSMLILAAFLPYPQPTSLLAYGSKTYCFLSLVIHTFNHKMKAFQVAFTCKFLCDNMSSQAFYQLIRSYWKSTIPVSVIQVKPLSSMRVAYGQSARGPVLQVEAPKAKPSPLHL